MKYGSSGQESGCSLPVDTLAMTERHPCYSFDAHLKYARMHLPVAPHCNISCNYCNRKFDCVNESRPGVTSEILTPVAAKQKFERVREKVANLSVIGIAGPGDALANWENTREAIQLLKAASPDVVFCLSTNGLMLPEYAQEIVELGVRHVTVTVNCIDEAVGAKIYKYVNYRGQNYTGAEAARLLSQNQLAGISRLAEQGVLVKVNIVMIPDINDWHIPAVVKNVKEAGAFMTNIMPLIPAPGSVFERMSQTSMKAVQDMRDQCQLDMRQMRHCRQCRADAIGLLGEDRSLEFRTCQAVSPAAAPADGTENKKYRIAATSRYGRLVDLHFGHAAEFLIFEGAGQSFTLVERRPTAKYCLGMADCDAEVSRKEGIVEAIADCDAVLTMRIGYSARTKLQDKGIMVVEHCYTVDSGLASAAEQLALKKVM